MQTNQFADAVLGTGSILRSEPQIKWIVWVKEFEEVRTKILGKKSKYVLME
jgi:hypothetical protein